MLGLIVAYTENQLKLPALSEILKEFLGIYANGCFRVFPFKRTSNIPLTLTGNIPECIDRYQKNAGDFFIASIDFSQLRTRQNSCGCRQGKWRDPKKYQLAHLKKSKSFKLNIITFLVHFQTKHRQTSWEREIRVNFQISILVQSVICCNRKMWIFPRAFKPDPNFSPYKY